MPETADLLVSPLDARVAAELLRDLGSELLLSGGAGSEQIDAALYRRALADELRRSAPRRLRVLRMLARHYAESGATGMEQLVRQSMAAVDERGELPDRRSVATFGLVERSLWDTPLGDVIPDRLARLLNVHLVVLQDGLPTIHLNPGADQVVYLFRGRTESGLNHYWEVRGGGLDELGPGEWREGVQENGPIPLSARPRLRGAAKNSEVPRPADQEAKNEQPVNSSGTFHDIGVPQEFTRALPSSAMPDRIARHHQLGFSDPILSVRDGDNGRADKRLTVVDQLRTALVPVIGAAAWADEALPQVTAYLSEHALRPVLSELTRGGSLEIPINVGGWSGEIVVHGGLLGSTVTKTYTMMEIEAGTISGASIGEFFDGQILWGGNLVSVRGKDVDFTGNGAVAITHDSVYGQTSERGGELFSRTKLNGPGLLLESSLDLTFDFSGVRQNGQRLDAALRQRGQAPGLTTRLTAEVLISAYDRADAEPPTTHYLPSPRVQDLHALGWSEVLLDLYVLDGAGGRATQIETLLDQIAGAGRETYGDGWPAVRAGLAKRLDLLTLETELKPMMGAEPFEIDLGPEFGVITVTAEVTEMTHVQNATEPMELNAGTNSTLLIGTPEGGGWNAAVQGGFQGQGPSKGTNALVGPFSGGAQRSSDRQTTSQTLVRSGLSMKLKEQGGIFDGKARLNLRFAPPGSEGGTAHAMLGFRSVTPISELEKADGPAVFVARGPRRLRPATFHQGDQVPCPSDRIWDTGLSESTVVLDVLGGDWHDVVDETGADAYGRMWQDYSPVAHDAFQQELLAARLPMMTRGGHLDSPVAPKALAGLVGTDSWVKAGAQITAMHYLHDVDKAELNPVNELSTGAAHRGTVATPRTGGGQSGVTDSPTGLAGTAGASVTKRHRDGWRAAETVTGVANGKFSEPMALFVVDARLPVEVVGGTQPPRDATGRFLIAIPRAECSTWRVEQDGPAVFYGPSGEPEPVKVTEPRYEVPPDKLAQGRLTAGDVVKNLTDDQAVLRRIEETVQGLPGLNWDHLRVKLARFEGPVLRAVLSALTRDMPWSDTVTVDGWELEISLDRTRVTALEFDKEVKGFEFEVGGDTRTSTGELSDDQHRVTLNLSGSLSVPYFSGSVGYGRNSDHTESQTRDGMGLATGKGKIVADAGLFGAVFGHVLHITARRPGMPAYLEREIPLELHGTVAIPAHELVPVGSDTVAEPKKPYAPPSRWTARRRFGASDLVIDLRQSGADSLKAEIEAAAADETHAFGAALRRVFGSSWRKVTAKVIAQSGNIENLLRRARDLSAGQRLTFPVPGGRVSVSLNQVWAATHTANLEQVEFNSGPSGGRSTGNTDGEGGANTAVSHVVTVTALGTADPLGASLVTPVGGLTGYAGVGKDNLDIYSHSVQQGQTIKAKVSGEAYNGLGELRFEFENTSRAGRFRRWWLSGRVGLLQRAVRNRTMDRGRVGLPVPPSDTAQRQRIEKLYRLTGELSGRAIASLPVEYKAAVETAEMMHEATGSGWSVPPEVLKEGMSSDWIIRDLPDVGSLHQLLRAEGTKAFGSSFWGDWHKVVERTFSRQRLMHETPAMTRGEPLRTPRLWSAAGGAHSWIEARAEVVDLRFERTADKSELSPVRGMADRRTIGKLQTRMWRLAAMLGVQLTLDPDHQVRIGPDFGRAARTRKGGQQSGSGGVVLNAKLPLPLDYHGGYVKYTFTFHRGGKDVSTASGIVPVDAAIDAHQPVGSRSDLTG
ncbi:MAG TPA: hypothetical protein VNW94_03015 [Streptosporangiaceae bacterium]|nr:hypothetical protein [Streptosporangiaceae bacterium]